MNSQEKKELQELLDAGLDCILTDDQLQRLDRLLLNSTDARRYYLEEITMVTQLNRGATSLGIVPLQTNSTFGNLSNSWSLAIVGASLVAVLLALSIPWNKFQPSARFGGSALKITPEATGVATVVTSNGTSLDEDLKAGKRLKCGSYRFENGAISLTFQNGVKLEFEGPAEFEIKSQMLVSLRKGRARAHVPEGSEGFVLDVPGMEIKDLGTEFGVWVGDKGHTEVHVFTGAVELTRTGTEPEIVQEGTAISWNEGVRHVLDRTNGGFFATRESIGFRNWQHHAEKLCRDPSAIFFFDFEQDPELPGTLVNRIVGTSDISGSIQGPITVSGRWADKGGLLFEKGNDRVDIEIPGSYDAFTLSAWVCFTRFGEPSQAIFTTQDADPAEHHWQVTRDGSMRSGLQRIYGVSSATGIFKPGKWQHVAAVVDRQNGLGVYYVDGRKVISESFNTELPLVFGQCHLGAWSTINANGEVAYDRFFRGRIDEFGMFSRAFSDDEIWAIYLAGTLSDPL